MTITLEGGRTFECMILDVSLSGASIETKRKPDIGASIMIGKMRARVVRYHEHGIGVEFLDVQHPKTIKRHFG